MMKKFYSVLTLSIATSLALIGCSQKPNSMDETNRVVVGQELPSDETTNKQEGPIFENAEMNFRVKLPALLEGKVSEEITTSESNGETIRTATIYYQGESENIVALSFDEMSEKQWKQMQEEGGPLGVEMGTSDKGRVIVMHTLQSNPFEEGSADYEVVNQFSKQLKVVEESFEFID